MAEHSQLILIGAGLAGGIGTFLAPRYMIRSQRSFGRQASSFWINRLGGQSLLFGSRVAGAALAVWSILALVTWSVFRVPTPAAMMIAVVFGVVLGLWQTYRSEWVSSFIQETTDTTTGRIQVLLSVVAPGSPLPHQSCLPETPPQYNDRSDPMSSENLFLGGPVSLGYSTVFQFFTTTEGQLAQVTLESDIWVEVRNPESASSEKSVFDGEVSDVLPFSDVALAPGGREHLAKECYQSLTERYDSGFPADIRDGNGKSFTVKLDEPLPVMDERGHVSAVTLENLGILLRGSPMNASSLSNSTYHPKLLDGPV